MKSVDTHKFVEHISQGKSIKELAAEHNLSSTEVHDTIRYLRRAGVNITDVPELPAEEVKALNTMLANRNPNPLAKELWEKFDISKSCKPMTTGQIWNLLRPNAEISNGNARQLNEILRRAGTQHEFKRNGHLVFFVEPRR